ncbi:nitroreductase family protein [Aciduricibacillus chroicocephali]|uniref:Nitroreductase family protein n=1 Tax=Aciduricibacillus chroicocephali TaxID=3054939 RepID=A0ABY9KUH7_9BACI|nr:nitroreductase family protein [Bacillaceae bacterium 44XB]
MSYQKTNDFNHILKGRRSVKDYDTSVKISREEMTEILETATRAPSSVNMQPWRFVIVESDEAKAKLKPLVRFNQNQLATSAAMIAIFGDLKNFEKGEEIYSKAVELGYMPQEVKDDIFQAYTPYYESIPRDKMKDVVLIDGGLVAMQIMLTARAHGYDTNPIGGFEKDQVADALGLDAERYVPVMLLSIGKSNKEGHQSYRLPVEQITEWQ